MSRSGGARTEGVATIGRTHMRILVLLAGLVAGSVVTLFFFLNPGLRPWNLHEGILGLLVHLPFLVVGSLLQEPQPESHVNPPPSTPEELRR